MATATEASRRLARFTRTERAVHWVHASAFVVLLGSGLCLYLPSLAEARPLPRAHALHFVSAEKPYDDYLTLQQVGLSQVMLAYEMDGKPLAREHGAPVRVVIPEMYGYKNVKWVERIVVGRRLRPGYWEQRGYDVDAWVGRSNAA